MLPTYPLFPILAQHNKRMPSRLIEKANSSNSDLIYGYENIIPQNINIKLTLIPKNTEVSSAGMYSRRSADDECASAPNDEYILTRGATFLGPKGGLLCASSPSSGKTKQDTVSTGAIPRPALVPPFRSRPRGAGAPTPVGSNGPNDPRCCSEQKRAGGRRSVMATTTRRVARHLARAQKRACARGKRYYAPQPAGGARDLAGKTHHPSELNLKKGGRGDQLREESHWEKALPRAISKVCDHSFKKPLPFWRARPPSSGRFLWFGVELGTRHKQHTTPQDLGIKHAVKTRWLEGEKVDICFLQETRMSGIQEFTLSRGWFYAGTGGEKGEEGVAALISPKVHESLYGYVLYVPRHMQIMIRTVVGPVISDDIHAHCEEAPATARDEFFTRVMKSQSEGTQAWPRFLLGDFNVRWHTVRDHETTHLGPWVGGRGENYLQELEKKQTEDNRRRWWDTLVGTDMIDLGSRFRHPPWLLYTYRDPKSPTGSFPTPEHHAALDRVCTRPESVKYVTNVKAVPQFGAKSHHVPLEVDILCRAAKKKPPKPKESLRLDPLKHGDKAEERRQTLRREMLARLPDPNNLSLSLEELHAGALNATKGALNIALPTPKPRKVVFKNNWLTGETKDIYEQALEAVETGDAFQARSLKKRYKKRAREDQRDVMYYKIRNGSWDKTKGWRRNMKLGSNCVKGRSGVLRSANARAQVFADKLEHDIWRSGKSAEETLKGIPDFLKNSSFGHRDFRPDHLGRPASPYEIRGVLRGLPGCYSARPTGIAYEVWTIFGTGEVCINNTDSKKNKKKQEKQKETWPLRT